MADNRLAGIAAGLLAGAAGATAHDAVTYLYQAVTGGTSPSSPRSNTPAATAEGAQGGSPSSPDAQSAAAGPLGGVLVSLAVGAAAGALRGETATPPQPLAMAAVGGAAWGGALAGASVTGAARPTSPASTVVEAVSHLAYGVVTVLTLHWLLDPQTPLVRRA